MDFFACQDSARRQTRLLGCYFALAVVCMVVVLYLLTCTVVSLGDESTETINFWQPEVFVLVSGGTVLIIFLGSLYKTMELRAGGESVAEMLGGRRLNPGTTDLGERRILNVVEEMALASGIPAPPVYLLDDEQSINAFAAGFTPGDAVIGLNRGTLNYLTRDELQGVVAHEFSHIMNGDMRLNLRLIGLLHGILLISVIGYYIMRLAGSGNRAGRSSGSKKGDNTAGLLLIGLAMWLIGLIGMFFARLIKAAISRQREYLADAAAVQFTRNPDGIGGALKKIGGVSVHGRIQSPEAESASHMFFVSAFRTPMLPTNPFSGMMSTHPPLDQRISRIDPRFDGKYPKPQPLTPREADTSGDKARSSSTAKQGPFGAVTAGMPRIPILPGSLGEKLPFSPLLILEAIGTVQPEMVEYAARLREQLPESVQEAIHEPFSARAVAFVLLLDNKDEQVRKRQLSIIEEREGAGTRDAVLHLAQPVQEIPLESRLPILEILQGTLRNLSPEQFERFRDTVHALVKADERTTLFEFILSRLLLHHLERIFGKVKPPKTRYLAISAVTGEIETILSLLARAGHPEETEATQAFQAGLQVLGLENRISLQPFSALTPTKLDQALNKLEQSSAGIRKRLLSALLAAAGLDGQITVREAELLRVLADAIDCPMAPLVASEIPLPAKP